MRRPALFVTVLAFVGASLTAIPASGAVAALPSTVPSVQQAIAGTGTGFSWTGTGRIVVDDSALTADATTFATDLAGLLGGPVPSVVSGEAQPGDISLGLGNTDPRLGTEGYGLTIGPAMKVSAPTSTGAFWASRTILQLLRQQKTFPATIIADWPRYKVRAISVSLDGFAAGWFTSLIRDMSYVKLNEITTGSALSKLTDAQLRTIQQVADQYHVKFVGWFNTTHYNKGAVPPEYQLSVADTLGVVGKSSSTLDITKPAAVSWATTQIEKYMNLQTAPIWHAGGDEYPMYYLRNDAVTAANTPDLYAVAHAKYPADPHPAASLYNALFNQVDDQAKSHGKQLRIWNDDLVSTSAVKLDPDIVVDHWINYGLTPAQLLADGHHLINSNQQHLYFNEHQSGAYNATDTDLWTTFDPGIFSGDLPIPQGGNNPALDGIKLNTWHGKMHEAPAALELDLLALDRPLAERAWATAKPTTPIASARALFAAIGRGPGVVQTPASGDPGTRSLPGSPSIVYLGSQQVFFVGAGGQLRRRYWKAGYTSVQEAAVVTTAPVTGRPMAFVGNNQVHVFAIGTDGHLQHAFYDPGTNVWTHDDWTVKSGTAGTAISGDLTGFAYANQLHVFARGNDSQLRHYFFDGSTGKVNADNWGGDLTGTPVAVAWGKVQNVFAVGSDGALHQWWWQWSDLAHIQHRSLGGTFPLDARPAAADFLENLQDVTIRDAANHVWLWSYNHNTGTAGWRDLTAETGVAAAGNPLEFTYPTERHIFVRRTGDNHLAHLIVHQDGSIASDDWTTADTLTTDPVGFNFENKEQHVFATTPAGKLHHWFWLATDHQVHQDNWPA